MILVVVLFFMSISIVCFSLYTGISPMPSSSLAKEEMIKKIPINAARIYELGSGWGGLAFRISKDYPQAVLSGFEISFFPWLVSKIIGAVKQNAHLTFYRKNFYNESFHHADVIVCYLYPGAMEKLKIKFEKELQPGTWVISNTFAVPGWVPHEVVRLKNLWKTEILIYKI